MQFPSGLSSCMCTTLFYCMSFKTCHTACIHRPPHSRVLREEDRVWVFGIEQGEVCRERQQARWGEPSPSRHCQRTAVVGSNTGARVDSAHRQGLEGGTRGTPYWARAHTRPSGACSMISLDSHPVVNAYRGMQREDRSGMQRGHALRALQEDAFLGNSKGRACFGVCEGVLLV